MLVFLTLDEMAPERAQYYILEPEYESAYKICRFFGTAAFATKVQSFSTWITFSETKNLLKKSIQERDTEVDINDFVSVEAAKLVKAKLLKYRGRV